MSKNTLKARRILADKAPELMEKAIQEALDGDIGMLRMLTEKVVGKGGLQVTPNIPSKGSTKKKTEAIMEALRVDGVTHDDIAGHVATIRTHQQATELAELKSMVKKAKEKKR